MQFQSPIKSYNKMYVGMEPRKLTENSANPLDITTLGLNKTNKSIFYYFCTS